MNILITSVGRRVGLVQAFKKELKDQYPESLLFTTDLNPEFSPACHFSDKSIKVGLFTDPDYISILLKHSIQNDIKLIIPTLDTELELLSRNRNIFTESKIEIVLSEEHFIQICSDKNLTADFFNQQEILTPKIYHPSQLEYPVFIKPKNGSNSKGIYLAKKISEIQPVHLKSSDMMFMEYMDPRTYDEYTVDAYYSKDNILICAVPRIRLKVVGGESNQGITKKNYLLEMIKTKLSNIPGAVGCITLQFFINKNNEYEVYGLEINPRFGGGYPFAYNSGANFPKMIIEEYLNRSKVKYDESWKDNFVNLRYEKEVFFSK